jgi:hypothetical protein
MPPILFDRHFLISAARRSGVNGSTANGQMKGFCNLRHRPSDIQVHTIARSATAVKPCFRK